MIVQTKEYTIRRPDLIFPELSFLINGVLFDVFKELGGGLRERYYQDAVRIGLQSRGIVFREQYYVPMKFHGRNVGKYYLDFLIENKIVLELKRGKYLPVSVINQAKQYLIALDIPLAIIACFAYDSVVPKRIVHHGSTQYAH